jgi:hypothetical protein
LTLERTPHQELPELMSVAPSAATVCPPAMVISTERRVKPSMVSAAAGCRHLELQDNSKPACFAELVLRFFG